MLAALPVSHIQVGSTMLQVTPVSAQSVAEELWVNEVVLHSMQSPGSILGLAGRKVRLPVICTCMVLGCARFRQPAGGDVLKAQLGVRHAVWALASLAVINMSAPTVVIPATDTTATREGLMEISVFAPSL